jgi:hypothetical protein
MPEGPDEVTKNPDKAGLRCARLLREAGATKAAKIILYSVFPKDSGEDDLPETTYLVKESDWQNLVEEVKGLIDTPAAGTPGRG